jgi:type IV pilus modification protein PilV
MGADKLHINKKQGGFTLLEVLVAIVLLAIGLSAAASMQAIALNSNAVANRVSIANFLAQQIAEEIGSRNISDPVLNSNVTKATYMFVNWSNGVEQPPADSLNIPGAGVFKATYTITTNTYDGVAGPLTTGMTEIQVTVNFSPDSAHTIPFYYTTYKMVL